MLVLSRKQRCIVDHLKQETACTPNVNGVVVWCLEDYLRSAIHSTLHITESYFIVFATGAKVNQLDVSELVVCEENVLRFYVTVYYTFVLHKLQRLEKLLSYQFYLDPAVHVLVILLILQFLVLVKADSEEISNYYNAVLHHNRFFQVQKTVVTLVVIGVWLQQLLH